MGLFSGLERFGFKNTDMKVYESENEKNPTEMMSEPVKEEQKNDIKEENYLFLKTYKCPVCDAEFKSLTVRSGKLRMHRQEDDLRPLYREMDPIKYDAIVCTQCGYAAVSRYFGSIMPHQGRIYRTEVQAKFKGMQTSVDIYDYDEAIMRYKMVLMCDVLGGVKNSQKAYTCLKLAWVMRGKIETEGPKLSPDGLGQLQSDERECIQNAYDGYINALATENFPMSGMDEMTLTCLVAELAFRLEKYRDSLIMVSEILGKKDAPSRIKAKALDLKERIRMQVKR